MMKVKLKPLMSIEKSYITDKTVKTVTKFT